MNNLRRLAIVFVIAASPAYAGEIAATPRIIETIILVCSGRDVVCTESAARLKIVCARDFADYADCPKVFGKQEWAPIQDSAQYRSDGPAGEVAVVQERIIYVAEFRAYRLMRRVPVQ